METIWNLVYPPSSGNYFVTYIPRDCPADSVSVMELYYSQGCWFTPNTSTPFGGSVIAWMHLPAAVINWCDKK